MQCIFCNLIASGIDYIVYEDDNFIVIPDRDSLGFGHCMIIPKKHVVKVYELNDTIYTQLFDLAKSMAKRLEEITNKKSVAYTAFGSGLPHAHLHLVPHDDIDVLINPIKHMQRKSPEELQEMAAQLKAGMFNN